MRPSDRLPQEQLQKIEEEMRSLLQLVASPGWEFMRTEIERQVDQLFHKAIGATDAHESAKTLGMCASAKDILTFPQKRAEFLRNQLLANAQATTR